MKMNIGNFISAAGQNLEYRLKRLCGKPSPVKRFVTVLIIGGALAIGNIYFVVSSIYSIGRKDAEAEFLKLQHIETLNLQQDSVQSIKN